MQLYMSERDEQLQRQYADQNGGFLADLLGDDDNGGHDEERFLHDLETGVPDSDLIRALRGENKGGVMYEYGGEMAKGLSELQIVKVWRPQPFGPPQLCRAIVHRVHKDDNSVTVQFVPDQHRARVPRYCIQPVLGVEPRYPDVWLEPGQSPPTREEILRIELEKERMREMGIPVPDSEAPPDGGFLNRQHRKIERVQRWGIPATTLDALRNRSIPPFQVEGTYGRHFYSNLYKNNFYVGKQAQVTNDGHVDNIEEQQIHVTNHTYIPIHGQRQTQMPDGTWMDEGESGWWGRRMGH